MALKPPYHHEPKSKRLPLEKRMTIAIGLIANDGIVVAADTEESGGFLKSGQNKILTVGGHIQLGHPAATSQSLCGACLISGAGESAYIDNLSMDLADVFLDNPTLGGAVLKKEFGKCVREFYREHVIPFAGFPDHDRPDIRMLIAVQRNHQPHLFFTSRSVTCHGLPYKAVGVGSSFAKILLDGLWKMMSVSEAEVLAAYVVFMAKECVEGCGKFTSIATLHGSQVVQSERGATLVPSNPVVTHLSAGVIEDLEKSFRTRWGADELKMVWKGIAREARKLSSRSK
jgi:hypothetical protein